MEKNSRVIEECDKALVVVSTTKLANDNPTTHQPHDKFVKCAFKIKAIALDFFASHLAKTGLGKRDLKNLNLSNSEHQQPFRGKLLNDLVYRGQIKNQDYYIVLEHQSSHDKTMLVRLLEYTIALITEHTVQGRSGMPVVLSICLYHDAGAHHRKSQNRGWGDPTRLADYFAGQEHANRSPLEYSFTLVDLTKMSDEEISSHGHAAIVEWILKDASLLPGDAFFQRAMEHLTHPSYSVLEAGFEDFKLALYEYILSVYEGDKSPDELIAIMGELLPQERGIMLTAAQQLRKEGMQQGMQQGMHKESLLIAERMLHLGIERDTVKQCTELTDEELAQLLPDRAESTPLSHRIEVSRDTARLMQSIAGTAEQTAGGEISTTTASHPEIGLVSPAHKRVKEL